MKKILALLLSSTTGLIIVAIIILVPILMIMDFFGANITDGYVENNMEYAEQYKSVVNKNVKNNNNLRDVYYRTILLGGQEEEMYQETNRYELELSLKRVGSDAKK